MHHLMKSDYFTEVTHLIHVTFSNFNVDPEVIRRQDVVNPPGETSLLLLNPPLIKEHVLGSKWHWMPWYGWVELFYKIQCWDIWLHSHS